MHPLRNDDRARDAVDLVLVLCIPIDDGEQAEREGAGLAPRLFDAGCQSFFSASVESCTNVAAAFAESTRVFGNASTIAARTPASDG